MTKMSTFSSRLLKFYLPINYICRQTRLFVSHFSVEKNGPLKVLFYGTDNFSEVTLKALNDNRISGQNQVVREIDVVCVPVDSPVKRYAESSNLRIHFWPFVVPVDCYDVGVVVSFGHLIPTKSILACKYSMINAHPSLLPRWRGAAPIVHTILQGDTETGVTVIQVAPKRFDVGNILMQEKYNIPPRITQGQLSSVLSELAAGMVIKTLQNLPELLKNSCSQPKEGVTLAPKIKSTDGCISWADYSWSDADKRNRALKGLLKTYTFWKDMKVYIIELVDHKDTVSAKIPSLVPNDVPAGFCYYHKKRKHVFVKCKDDWVGIKYFAIPGRQLITAQEFYNGFLSKVTKDEHIFHSASCEQCSSNESNY